MTKRIPEIFANAVGKFIKLFPAYVGILFEIPCYGMVFYSYRKNIMLSLKKRVQFTFISFLFCYSFLYVSVYA